MDRLLPLAEGGEARVFEAMRYSSLGGGKRLRAFFVLAGATLFKVAALSSTQDRERHRVRARLFADPRRSAGDGRRRSAARQTLVPQAVRRGDGDPGGRCAAGAGLRGAGARGHARRSRRPRRAGERTRQGGRRARHGGRPDARPAGREAGRRHVDRRHHAPAAAQDRRADLVLLHGRRDPGQGARADAGGAVGLRPRSRARLPDRRRSARRRRQRPELGKTPGKDQAAGKATFVSILGLERARAQADAGATGRPHLEPFGAAADLLRQAAKFVVSRRA